MEREGGAGELTENMSEREGRWVLVKDEARVWSPGAMMGRPDVEEDDDGLHRRRARARQQQDDEEIAQR